MDLSSEGVADLRTTLKDFQASLDDLQAVAEGRLDTAITDLRTAVREFVQAAVAAGREALESAKPVLGRLAGPRDRAVGRGREASRQRVQRRLSRLERALTGQVRARTHKRSRNGRTDDARAWGDEARGHTVLTHRVRTCGLDGAVPCVSASSPIPRASKLKLAEQRTFNPRVVGSSPTGPTPVMPAPRIAAVGRSSSLAGSFATSPDSAGASQFP